MPPFLSLKVKKMIFETSAIKGKAMKAVILFTGLAILGMTFINLTYQIRLNRRRLAEDR